MTTEVIIWWFIFLTMLLGWMFATFYPKLSIARRKNTLTIFNKGIFIIGLLIDIFLQITVFNLIFLEPAREWTISERIARLANTDINGWRGRLAYWFYKRFLHPHDPGHEGVRYRD